MLNKVVLVLLFVFLAIAPAFAASPEQPNSVPQDTNSSNKWMPKSATLVEESPNSVPTEPNTRTPDIFDTISDNEINTITADSNSRMHRWQEAPLIEQQPNSVVEESNSELTYLQEKIEKANKGDSNAQYYMGLTYYLGEGKEVKQDYNEALKWYTRAAKQGNADAQQMIGQMYYYGKGVTQDYNEALIWYSKAAELGNGSAKQSLGEMYYYGEGIPRDYNKALKWLLASVQSIKQEQKAMKELEKRAGYKEQPLNIESFLLKDTYFTLGVIYDNGEGTTRDYNEAVKWYKKAADGGIKEAQFNLGNMYSKGIGVPQDEKEAVRWYTLAALKGDREAQNNLGSKYEFGTGVSQNYKEAVKWYKKSAEQGCARAQRNLARMYFEGKGVIEDYVEAYKWALIAGMNGDNVTIIKQNIAEKMTYAQIAEAQRIAKEFVAKKENEKDSGSSGTKERSTPKASGTGFFISPSGYIITAAHVVEKSRSLTIFSSAGKFEAKVILLDEPTDIAILKVDGAEFPYLDIVSSSAVAVGDKVFTVGFPNVPIQGTEPKYTDGTISSLSGIDDNIRHFQISIPVQPGNSGGPLVTERGDVIGVVVSKLNDIDMLEATGTLPQNVNYAVKSAFIFPLLENLPGWQTPKAKSGNETMSNSDIINKARNAVAFVLVY